MVFDDLQDELELFLSPILGRFVALNDGHALICIFICDLEPRHGPPSRSEVPPRRMVYSLGK